VDCQDNVAKAYFLTRVRRRDYRPATRCERPPNVSFRWVGRLEVGTGVTSLRRNAVPPFGGCLGGGTSTIFSSISFSAVGEVH
jgi:hypothetical protein